MNKGLMNCDCEPFQSCEHCRVDLSKPDKHKKNKPKKDKAHLNWVASQGCMIPGCLESPSVHHIRILGEPRDDRRTIPLCYNHHQGPNGIHFLGKHVFRQKFGHELLMLKILTERKNEI